MMKGQILRQSRGLMETDRPCQKETARRRIIIHTWGKKAQQNIARLRVSIVGLESVECIVAEALARIGRSGRNVAHTTTAGGLGHDLGEILFPAFQRTQEPSWKGRGVGWKRSNAS